MADMSQAAAWLLQASLPTVRIYNAFTRPTDPNDGEPPAVGLAHIPNGRVFAPCANQLAQSGIGCCIPVAPSRLGRCGPEHRRGAVCGARSGVAAPTFWGYGPCARMVAGIDLYFHS